MKRRTFLKRLAALAVLTKAADAIGTELATRAQPAGTTAMTLKGAEITCDPAHGKDSTVYYIFDNEEQRMAWMRGNRSGTA